MPHPIRTIRELLKKTPPEVGLRQYSTAGGFAKLIERSPSWVRNVESGYTKSWEHLAKVIEEKTGVSEQWLLGDQTQNPEPIDISGGIWDPIYHLDPLAPSPGMPDWRELIRTSPEKIPDIIDSIIRPQLTRDMETGDTKLLEEILRIYKGKTPINRSELKTAQKKMEENSR